MRKSISILIPGAEFSWQWVHYWTMFICRVLAEYDASVTMSISNNIYSVRNKAIQDSQVQTSDYVLWIDSDNLVTIDSLNLLMAALEDPEVSACGGWYYIQSGGFDKLEVAAGWMKEGLENGRPDAGMLAGKDPIEVDYLGFGFLLMKAGMVRAMGQNPFRPEFRPDGVLLPDDSSFCAAAKRLGYRFFLHPQVHVPHLKLQELTSKEDYGKL